MGSNEVALASLAVLATCIGLMVWVVKKVLGDVAPALTRHADTAISLKEAVDANTIASTETITFLRKLNGRLPKLVEEKLEQARNEE